MLSFSIKIWTHFLSWFVTYIVLIYLKAVSPCVEFRLRLRSLRKISFIATVKSRPFCLIDTIENPWVCVRVSLYSLILPHLAKESILEAPTPLVVRAFARKSRKPTLAKFKGHTNGVCFTLPRFNEFVMWKSCCIYQVGFCSNVCSTMRQWTHFRCSEKVSRRTCQQSKKLD